LQKEETRAPRYGRYAWDISSTHQRFAASAQCVHNWDHEKKMVEKTTHVVRRSIEALRDNDAEMAKSLAKTENEVDEIYSCYLDELARASPITEGVI